MTHSPTTSSGSRQGAFWGNENRAGEHRASVLWGHGCKLRVAVLLATAAALAAPATGTAAGRDPGEPQALVPTSLLAAATANPQQVFHVIVQGRRGQRSSTIEGDVNANNQQEGDSGGKRGLRRSFRSISGVAVDLTGRQLLRLTRHPHVLAITPDLATHSESYQDAEMWRQSADVTPLWGTLTDPGPQAPAIAVVDSGVDASGPDFTGRVVASVNLSSLAPGATGDQQGHGTMVAGIAAGSAPGHEGVAPNAPLVDVRTSDSAGKSLTSDVIAACDWILAHKDQYGIRVVNISQAAQSLTSFHYDPLDRAVERLWLNGIVVVTAAGNYGSAAGPVDMSHAPGNDPFVITVGALDQNGTTAAADDTAPFWSAFGHTVDGFAKPELSAPGRYLIMPVPDGSTIAAALPERVVAPGYMWMSGTSFAAPVVAGAAAQALARHPLWTPDQVKGALMLSAGALPAAGFAGGVGEVDAAAAAAVALPPNPNAGLDQFVTVDPGTGAPVFDAEAWAAAANVDPAWNAASWNEASWNSASWNAASWNAASWNQASWNEASWNEASWNEASWNEASWNESTLLP